METIVAFIHRLDSNTVFIFHDQEDKQLKEQLKSRLAGSSAARTYFIKDYQIDVDSMYTVLKLAFHDTIDFEGQLVFLTLCNEQISHNIMERADVVNLLAFKAVWIAKDVNLKLMTHKFRPTFFLSYRLKGYKMASLVTTDDNIVMEGDVLQRNK